MFEYITEFITSISYIFKINSEKYSENISTSVLRITLKVIIKNDIRDILGSTLHKII